MEIFETFLLPFRFFPKSTIQYSLTGETADMQRRGSVASAFRKLLIVLAGTLALEGADFPQQLRTNREILCPEVRSALPLDGDTEQKAWKALPWSEGFIVLDSLWVSSPVKTAVALARDADYLYVKTRNDQAQNETSENYADRTVSTLSDSRSQLFAEKLVFSYPIGRGTLDWGEEYTHTDYRSCFNNAEGILSGNDNKVTENNVAAFLDYGLKLGKWNLYAGVRYEHVNFRYMVDGTLQEGQSKTYNNVFPSFSVGWRVTEEPFMKEIKKKWLNNLKIRYSYGEVGSDKGAPRFNYIQLFDSGGNAQFGLDQTVNFGPKYTEGALAYPNATWETAVKQNLGIEMTLFHNLRITVDLFDEKRDGILMARKTVAPWMGADLPSVNIGKTKNHGIDLEAEWNGKIGPEFRYFAKFTFSTSENRIVFRDDPNKLDDYLKDAGKPIGYSSKYLATGNFASIDDIFNYTQTAISATNQNKLVPGDLVYMDYNADGVIDDKDVVPVKNLNYPLTTYGLTIGFSWKGLALNALFYAATGVYKADINDFLYDFPRGNVKAQPNTLDRWTVEDAGATEVIRPAVHLDNTYNSKGSTYNYTDYSYLRLKNLELSYQLPKKWTKAMRMSGCQLYVNGNNLFTVSGVDSRRDPENGGAAIYPIVKRYNIGVRLSF